MSETIKTGAITRIGASELGFIEECRRQFVWGKFYEPKRPPIRYWEGTGVHSGLEMYYRKGRDPEAAMVAVDEFVGDSFKELENRFKETWVSYLPEFKESAKLVSDMVNNYTIYDQEDPFEGEIFEVEEHYSVPMVKAPWGMVYLSGRIDLVLNTPSGFVIVDHKTQNDSSFPGGLDMDEQLTAYSYLFWKRHKVIPRSLFYNILVKSLPKAPTILKDGTLSKSIIQSTVYPLFEHALETLELDPTPYQPVLSKLRKEGWSKYFFRVGSTRNERELLNFERRTKLRIKEVIEMFEDPEKAYPTGSNYRCKFCSFIGPCKSLEDGGDHQWVLDTQFLRKE